MRIINFIQMHRSTFGLETHGIHSRAFPVASESSVTSGEYIIAYQRCGIVTNNFA